MLRPTGPLTKYIWNDGVGWHIVKDIVVDIGVIVKVHLGLDICLEEVLICSILKEGCNYEGLSQPSAGGLNNRPNT